MEFFFQPCGVFLCFQLISYNVLRWLCVRHASIGAAFVGHMDKLPQSKKASVVWEVQPCWLIILNFTKRILAGGAVSICTSIMIAVCSREVKVQTGSGAAKIFGVKPKIYLTASVVLPPDSWAKVSWEWSLGTGSTDVIDRTMTLSWQFGCQAKSP